MKKFCLTFSRYILYEDYIRKALISRKINHVDELQKEAVKYVSAKSQAEFLHKLIEEEFFTEEEMSIIKRARNYKSKSHPKNCILLLIDMLLL